MTEIRQVRLCGFGGQGIVLAGLLLGEGGVIDGKYVSGSNSYGAQARGSECRAEIILSDRAVDFPHLTIADFLLAMSQATYDLYSKEVREGGLILYDEGLVAPQESLYIKQAGVPATETSVKELKNKQVANIVLLGAFVGCTNIVSPKAIQKAISIHVNERFQSLNLKALRLGMKLGRGLNG
jgi:2-oxoglutarate ferredoxin oxidoreductase subunit gamma